MDLQAIRYAAMVSTMTWRQAVEAHSRYLTKLEQPPEEAEPRLLRFLKWVEPRESDFAQDVRIVLVSADFHPEIAAP